MNSKIPLTSLFIILFSFNYTASAGEIVDGQCHHDENDDGTSTYHCPSGPGPDPDGGLDDGGGGSRGGTSEPSNPPSTGGGGGRGGTEPTPESTPESTPECKVESQEWLDSANMNSERVMYITNLGCGLLRNKKFIAGCLTASTWAHAEAKSDNKITYNEMLRDNCD